MVLVIDMVLVAIPVENNNGENSIVAARFARAPYIALIDVDRGTIRSLNIIQNPHMYGRGGVGIIVSQWLANQGVQIVIAPSVGPNAASVLQSMGIMIKNVPPGITIRDAIIQSGI